MLLVLVFCFCFFFRQTFGSIIQWFICMHAGDVEYDVGKTKQGFEQMQQMGFNMVRTDFDWHRFQSINNSDYFTTETISFFDQYVDLATEHGLGVIAILSQAPGWAMDLYKAGEVDAFLDAYKRYARKMAELYGDRVRYFQYWNEPNNVINPIASDDRWKVYLAADQGVRQANNKGKF